MENQKNMGFSSTSCALVTLLVLTHQMSLTFAQQRIGVCYGLNGDNLPSPADVIALYKSHNIQHIRLYEPVPAVLEALRGSNLLVSLGMRNEDITPISQSQDAANAWVSTYVAPYVNDVIFGYVTVGNEVIPGPFAQDVPLAMNYISVALKSIGQVNVKVTTVVASSVLAASYPPSEGAFLDEVNAVMTNIAYFLRNSDIAPLPLMINVYPYFAYASNPEQIALDYALLNPNAPVVIDGQFTYTNLFDAMVDAFNAALEKIGYPEVYVTVSEAGWPSAGNDPITSVDNARIYNNNLKQHIQSNPTPRRPGQLVDLFYFAMFNEDLKAPGVEQNWGLFYPDMQPVYSLW